MARERLMDEAKRCTVVVDQWQYDVGMELVREGVHPSFSDLMRKALKDYLDSMEEYIEQSREENKAKRDSRMSVIGRGIDGKAILLPHYMVEQMSESNIGEYIDRHNAMLDPDFYK